MITWEERMSARAKARDPARPEYERDENAWRKSNVVFNREGAILYPHYMPCEHCGKEVSPDRPYKDHPFRMDPLRLAEGDPEVCICGYHESYHRGHDCVKDNSYPSLPCACAGGQPWACCVNYHMRQKQFLLQKIANTLRAAAES